MLVERYPNAANEYGIYGMQAASCPLRSAASTRYGTDLYGAFSKRVSAFRPDFQASVCTTCHESGGAHSSAPDMPPGAPGTAKGTAARDQQWQLVALTAVPNRYDCTTVLQNQVCPDLVNPVQCELRRDSNGLMVPLTAPCTRGVLPTPIVCSTACQPRNASPHLSLHPCSMLVPYRASHSLYLESPNSLFHIQS